MRASWPPPTTATTGTVTSAETNNAPGAARSLSGYAAAMSRTGGPRPLSRLAELLRFGAVGAVAFVVDAGVFNLLLHGPGTLLGSRPLTAKVVAVALAMLVAWAGNRWWTFAPHRGSDPARELAAFVLVNLGGMLVAVGCLATSRYLLGLSSPLADNIAANVVGLALGTAFRYVAYRHLVFRTDATVPADAASAAALQSGTPDLDDALQGSAGRSVVPAAPAR